MEPYITSKQFLSTLLLNEDTENLIVKEYIENYINQHGLYHVFAKTRAAFAYAAEKHHYPYEYTVLIKTFLTEENAKNWILENGKKIIKEQEENYGPMALVIIPYDNNGIFYAGDEPYHPGRIPAELYPTFVFSQKSYNMLIKELKASDYEDPPVNHIHYIKHTKKHSKKHSKNSKK